MNDVSPVVFPAYPDTAVAVRALAAWQAETRRSLPVAILRRRLELALATAEGRSG